MCAAKVAKEGRVRTWNLEPVWSVAVSIVMMMSDYHFL